MASTFTTRQKATTGIGKLFGGSTTEEIYLQFVPGVVLDVVVNSNSAAYTTIRDLNSIIAKSHVSNDVEQDSVNKTRYYPLMRGIVDVPTKGDPVLLCTFGGVNYYLGPLATMNNPNFNMDHLDIQNYNLGDNGGKVSIKDRMKISKNFTTVGVRRLQKLFNPDLDGEQKVFNEYRNIFGKNKWKYNVENVEESYSIYHPKLFSLGSKYIINKSTIFEDFIPDPRG